MSPDLPPGLESPAAAGPELPEPLRRTLGALGEAPLADPELVRLLAAWGTLPHRVRRSLADVAEGWRASRPGSRRAARRRGSRG